MVVPPQPTPPSHLDKVELSRASLLHTLRRPDLQLITLTAPNGYGKTTLLHLLSEDPHTCHIRLSDADPDPVSITRLIAESLQLTEDDKLHYELKRASLTARGAGAALRREFQQRDHLTLMLDDLDTLDSEGRRFVADSVLTQLPPRTRLILARTVEANMRVRHLKTKFGERMLDITEEDLTLSYTTIMRIWHLNDLQIKETKGWPAAVELTAIGLDPRTAVQDLLGKLPEALYPSLRRASLLPTWRLDDPVHVTLGLQDGWLTKAREFGLPLLQLGPETFEPHPLLKEELERELRQLPNEYRAANNALGATLQDQQPIAAVDAFLRADNQEQASQLLEQVLPDMTRSEQVQATLEQLQQVVHSPQHPLYLAYAQAVFNTGDMTGGLLHAQLALQTGNVNREAHAVLGDMRLRTGNLTEAAQHYEQALLITTDNAVALQLRAHLALALTMHPTRSDTAPLIRAEQEAILVLAEFDGGPDTQIVMLTAHTARTLTYAARGLRVEARLHADVARSTLNGMSPSLDSLRCMTLLASFYADDDQPDICEELLARAETMDIMHGDAALLMLLARAKQALRLADVDRCARYALRAIHLASEQHNVPQEYDAHFMLAMTSVFPNGADPTTLESFRSRFASTPDSGQMLTALRHGLKGLTTTLEWVNDNFKNLPPELYALQTIMVYQTKPSHSCEIELVRLRDRLGPGVLRAYATLTQSDLPASIAPPRMALEIHCLQTLPEILLNGQRLKLTESQLLLLILAAYRGQLKPIDAETVFGQTHIEDEAERLQAQRQLQARLTNLIYRIRKELEPLTYKGAFGLRGGLDVNSFQVDFDFARLSVIDARDLASVYRQMPFAAISAASAGPLLEEMRVETRHLLLDRLRNLDRLDHEAAQATYKQLCSTDYTLRSLVI